MTVGVDTLPPLPKDAGDRNRTSPFAFTRQPLRVPRRGLEPVHRRPAWWPSTPSWPSRSTTSPPRSRPRSKKDPKGLNAAIQTLLTAIITEHGRVVFNGDGYAQAWHDEAEKRGLANLRTTVDALPVLGDPEVTAMFERYGVLSKRELESRQEVYLEHYVKSVATEARTAVEMARTIIFPAAVRYQGQLAATCVSLKALDYKFDTSTLDKITGLVQDLQDGIATLEAAMAKHDFASTLSHAQHACDAICPAMLALRQDRRRARGPRRRRPLVAGHLPGNALHQVVDGARARDRLSRRSRARPQERRRNKDLVRPLFGGLDKVIRLAGCSGGTIPRPWEGPGPGSDLAARSVPHVPRLP